MARVWSFIRAFWSALRRRKSPAPFAQTVEPGPSALSPIALAEVAPAPPLETPPAPTPALSDIELEDLDEVEEDEFSEEEGMEDEADDPSAPDPFVSDVRPAMDTLSPEALIERRAAARLEALSGEHKIYFSDPAGPGSLAEALNQLLQEGRVAAEFQDDNGDEAHLLYRPRAAQTHPTDGV